MEYRLMCGDTFICNDAIIFLAEIAGNTSNMENGLVEVVLILFRDYSERFINKQWCSVNH